MSNIFWLLLFLSICFVEAFKNDTCSEGSKACNTSLSAKIKEVSVINRITLEVRRALKTYQECSATISDPNCDCHASTITNDLKPYTENGISKEMLNVTAKYGTPYKIYNGRLYRHRHCLIPERCRSVEHFLLKIAANLPNLDFIIRVRDWPGIHYLSGLSGPIFSYSKTRHFLDIMYPAWSFWWNDPIILPHNVGIDRWDLIRFRVLTNVRNLLKWEDKINVAFFRGARSSMERDNLILLSRRRPDLVDASYTANPIQRTYGDTLGAPPEEDVSLEYHCQFKYLFNFRGAAASFRFRHLFLCNSLVFNVGDAWLEFFYSQLKPWVHYVPVKSNTNDEDLEHLLLYFHEHDNLAQAIAKRGQVFIMQHLRMYDIQCYWGKLLKEYAKLLKFEVEKNDRDFIEVSSTELQIYYDIFESVTPSQSMGPTKLITSQKCLDCYARWYNKKYTRLQSINANTSISNGTLISVNSNVRNVCKSNDTYI